MESLHPLAEKQPLFFLVTGIDNSVQLWSKSAHTMQMMLGKHDEILKNQIRNHQGHVFNAPGQSIYAIFTDPSQAIAAAVESQVALQKMDWSAESGPLKVKMVLHCGEATLVNGIYSGPAVESAVRLLPVIHGCQIVITGNVHQLVERSTTLPAGISFTDAGLHRLQDLLAPIQVFQLNGPDLTEVFPPLKSLDNLYHNLPIQASRLIGREHEIEQILTLIRDKGVRLVTFTGPGGSGKTRLSLQIAADLLHEFADGVFLVELAHYNQANQVGVAIARVLGLKESSGRALVENLKQFLRERQILLVLDNFEQVMDAAPLINELLSVAPRLKVLVSSRTLLKIYGEQEFAVPPLQLPAESDLDDLIAIQQCSAIELYVQRAQQARPGFELTRKNAATLAQVCIRLDGLPLAIELAAARSSFYQPEVMLEALNNRLQLLVNGPQTLPIRHQTLRATIEWGYDLLEEPEKILFERLGIFAGGCTTESAEAICNPEEDPDLDILDGLTSLLNKSLLRLVTVNGENEPRFSMLETIREYALEKLEERGELEKYQLLHANYFLSLAEEAAPYLTGAQQAYWFQRLAGETNNISTVMEWLLEYNSLRSEMALRIGSALWRFWTAWGYLSEGRRWLEKGLMASDHEFWDNQSRQASLTVQANAYNAAGLMARDQGDYVQARKLLEHCLKLQRELKNTVGIADALNALGTVTANLGDYEYSLSLHEESLTIRRTLKDERPIAISLCNLASVYFTTGNYNQSINFYEEALRILRQLGDIRTIGILLNNLSHMSLGLGDTKRARKLSEESLMLRKDIGDKSGIGMSLMLLADIEYAVQNEPKAMELYEESLAIFQQVGDVLNSAICLEGMAVVMAYTNRPVIAANLFGYAQTLRENCNSPMQPVDRPRYDRAIAEIRRQLSLAELEKHWHSGKNWQPADVRFMLFNQNTPKESEPSLIS